MLDQKSSSVMPQSQRLDFPSCKAAHWSASSSLVVHKAILALDTIADARDERWLLYAQSCWLFGKRWSLQSRTSASGLCPSAPVKMQGGDSGVRAFKENNIHGICVRDRKSTVPSTSGESRDSISGARICVYGDHSFRMFEACANSEGEMSFYPICEEQLYDDWIMTVRILGDDRLAVVSAHNRLSIFHADASVLYCTISCGDSHILYSAFIHEEKDGCGSLEQPSDGLIIFGGTFNYLSIWSPDTSKASCATLHKLQGHAGVIFDVKYDAGQHLLCSTSDDRSCRIYRVNFAATSGDMTCQEKWAGASFQLLHAVFGHEARVWRVRILANLRILTVGEDLRMCLWNGKDGRVMKQWSGQHSGLNTWSVTAIEVDQDWTEMFSGGADGSIVHNCVKASSVTGEDGSLPKVPDAGSSTAPGGKRVRHVAIIDEDKLLVLVDGGLLYSVESAKQLWTLEWEDDQLKQCVALTTHKFLGKTAIVTCSGKVAIYDPERAGEYTEWLLDVSCHCLEGVWVKNSDGKMGSLIVSGPCQMFHLLTYDNDRGSLHLVATMGMAKNNWITAAAQREHVLVCGDRGGSLRLFFLEKDRWKDGQVLVYVHGQSEVCQVEFVDAGVVSAGRSGHVIYWRLVENGLVKLRVIQPDKTIIEWISGFLLPAVQLADLVVFGFRSSKFIAMSMSTKEKVMAVECGGGHRSNDVVFFPSTCRVRFASVKTSAINWHDSKLPSTTKLSTGPVVLRASLHGLQIWSVRCLTISSEGCLIIATASEDTTIKVSAFPLDKEGMAVAPKAVSVIATGQEHLSSVRVLSKSLLMPNAIYSGGGRGQVFMWHCVDDQWTENLSVKASWSLYAETVRKRWSDQAILEPDTRIMDLDVALLSSQVEIVATASSDGRLRFFVTCPDSERWLSPMGETSPLQCCLLKVRLVQHGTSLWVVVAGTDGLLNILDITGFLRDNLDRIQHQEESGFPLLAIQSEQVLACRRLHQSGIDALDLLLLPTSQSLQIATGGDDGAICLLLALALQPEAAKDTATISHIAAHNAQISGLSWLDSRRLVSVAKDQLVKVWLVNWTDATIEVEHCLYTSVSDVSALSIYQMDKSSGEDSLCDKEALYLVVAGAGFQLLQLHIPPAPLSNTIMSNIVGGPARLTSYRVAVVMCGWYRSCVYQLRHGGRLQHIPSKVEAGMKDGCWEARRLKERLPLGTLLHPDFATCE